MLNNFIIIFLFSFIISLILTFCVKFFATKLKLVDKPGEDRKIHKNNIPLAGGLAIFFAFFIVIYLIKDKVLAGNLEISHWLGVFAGAVFLMIGGLLDDKYNLKPKLQIIWPILAILCVLVGGVSIEKITNPFGEGFVFLDSINILLFNLNGTVFYFTVFSDLLIFAWLMGMMYTTKLLDGVDGLVTGVTGIGGLIIFLFTMTTKYYQPDVGWAALVLAGACAGFLIINWHPAKIFLGEGGSLFLGFILGVLAIISGGKIAVALLIMGLPIMDVAWTILRRLKNKKNPFKIADKKHLHFRLLDLGIGQRKTVLIYYIFSAAFGLSALFLQSIGKVFVLGALVVIMLGVVAGFGYLDKKAVKND